MKKMTEELKEKAENLVEQGKDKAKSAVGKISEEKVKPKKHDNAKKEANKERKTEDTTTKKQDKKE